MGTARSTLDREDADAVREQEIERYAVLTTPPGRELQALVELTAQIFAVPTAAINLVTGTAQHQVATAGFEPSVCARSDSMCAAVLAEPAAVAVADARDDPRFADNPFVTGVIGAVRFYASAPLLTPAGVPIGRLCVFDDAPRRIEEPERRRLAVLAERIMDVLELRFTTQQVERTLGELTSAQQELRRSNEALLHFAGQVSHDLRNPLQVIRSNAELLGMEPVVATDPALSSVVEQITESTTEMASLIRDVLADARAGSLPRREPVDLRETVDRALRDLAPQVRESGADVTVGDLPRVHADPELLYAVMVNLLSNALKFRRPGTRPTIEVRARRHTSRWRVTVSDDGTGVPPGTESAVFLPYVRAAASTGTGTEGHGIGLATVHRIVHAHGGEVGLEPRSGGGTTAWFELPAGPADTGGEQPPAQAPDR
ncbi:ATP-binding protein [Ornithinimicrobium sp. LYQ92]|uniref:sensor histidine kinase n=1 Tax=Serinicoccus sp. LYQ92 TaxID=3378798 RepID=UPI00385310B6